MNSIDQWFTWHRYARLAAVAALVLTLLTTVCEAAPTATAPHATDSRITQFDFPHYSWLPQGPPRGQLFLFLPGTGGKPHPNFPLSKFAASLGYHVIELAYPDSVASQKFCSRKPERNAHMQFRLAIIRGGSYREFHVDAADSIDNRLLKLLQYLDREQPGQGWGNYLNGRGGIAWRKIAVAGHSQGGGHAFVIAKFNEVARVIMFGSPKDFHFKYNTPAIGFDRDTKTPQSRMYSFTHARDNGNGATHAQMMQILTQMGLTALGSVTTDNLAPPFNNAHVLTTNVNVQGSQFHGSVLGNGQYIGTTADQAILPVWKYMLTAGDDK